MPFDSLILTLCNVLELENAYDAPIGTIRCVNLISDDLFLRMTCFEANSLEAGTAILHFTFMDESLKEIVKMQFQGIAEDLNLQYEIQNWDEKNVIALKTEI